MAEGCYKVPLIVITPASRARAEVDRWQCKEQGSAAGTAKARLFRGRIEGLRTSRPKLGVSWGGLRATAVGHSCGAEPHGEAVAQSLEASIGVRAMTIWLGANTEVNRHFFIHLQECIINFIRNRQPLRHDGFAVPTASVVPTPAARCPPPGRLVTSVTSLGRNKGCPAPPRNCLTMSDRRGTSRASLERRFLRILELRVQGCAALCRECRLDKIEIEHRLQHIEIPFGFPRLHVDNLSRRRALDRMSRKITNIADGVKALGNEGGDGPRINHCLNFSVKVPTLYACLIAYDRLQIPTAESSTRLWTERENRYPFLKVATVWIGNLSRQWAQ